MTEDNLEDSLMYESCLFDIHPRIPLPKGDECAYFLE